VLAARKQDHALETERERETETEETSSSSPAGDARVRFEDFWEHYPRKVGKSAALQAWKRKVRNGDGQKILEALVWQRSSPDWLKDDGAFIPHPTTYLNQGRWMDSPPDQDPLVDRHKPAGRKPLTEEERRDLEAKGWV
jgi:hypothetical protein